METKFAQNNISVRFLFYYYSYTSVLLVFVRDILCRYLRDIFTWFCYAYIVEDFCYYNIILYLGIHLIALAAIPLPQNTSTASYES